MSSATDKNLVLCSVMAALCVALLAGADLITGFPFGGQMIMDLLFIVSGFVMGYMAWESYRDLH